MKFLLWFIGTYIVLVHAILLALYLSCGYTVTATGTNDQPMLYVTLVLCLFPALMIAADQTRRPPSRHH